MKQQAGGSDLFKQSHDPLTHLQNNFNDMTITKDTQSVSIFSFRELIFSN